MAIERAVIKAAENAWFGVVGDDSVGEPGGDSVGEPDGDSVGGGSVNGS